MWITAADVEATYGAPEVNRLADLAGDGVADAGVVDGAVSRAEGRVRSRLLTRYEPEDLPASPAEAPDILRRICVDLAWWELHKKASSQNEGAMVVRDDALADLKAIVDGGAALTLADEPAVDSTRPTILTSTSRPVCDRMSLENLELLGTRGGGWPS